MEKRNTYVGRKARGKETTRKTKTLGWILEMWDRVI
jgi:hypothetical protein